MTRYGFSLMCELHDPRSLVDQARRAEAAGFDFVTISDHFHRSSTRCPFWEEKLRPELG